MGKAAQTEPIRNLGGSDAKRLSRIGERGQIVIPKQIRDELCLDQNTTMEFEVRGREIVMRPKKDMSAFDKHLDKWTGALAGQLECDGYAGVEAFMDDIRERDEEYKRMMSAER